MRAAIYLRISEDKNLDGLAIDRQRGLCESIVAERGWTLVDTYTDSSRSAFVRTVSRPEYDRMVADYLAGKFDALVCYDLDRLTRQPRQLEDWIEWADERGLVLVTANGEADLATDGGRMFARIKASVARGEIERKSRRQKDKNAQLATQGRPIIGNRPFGFELDRVTIRESEAQPIREAYRTILDGGTVHSIVTRLNDAGVVTATGKAWSHQSVRRLLLRESNAGLLRYKGEIVGAIEGMTTPIVERETYDDAVSILTAEGRPPGPPPGRRSPVHWLAGVIVCRCGGRLRPWHASGRHKGVVYYQCENSRERRAPGPHSAIRSGIAEEAVRNAVYRVMAKRALAPEAANLKELRAKVAELDEQLRTQEELYGVPGVNKGRVRARIAELSSEVDRAQREVDSAVAERMGSEILSALMEGVRVVPFERQATDTPPQRFIDEWDAMSADVKRQMTLAAVSVSIGSGRGAKRLQITELD